MNYQIIKEKSTDGTYVPDYEELIKNASCAEEIEYIQHVETEKQKWAKIDNRKGFTYNMVYVNRMACGHFELFQTPCNEYWPLEEVLRMAEEESASKCTKCSGL